jgi:hypothetical protein
VSRVTIVVRADRQADLDQISAASMLAQALGARLEILSGAGGELLATALSRVPEDVPVSHSRGEANHVARLCHRTADTAHAHLPLS